MVWVSIGLLAGAFLGFGRFFYATSFAKYGAPGIGAIGPSTVIIVLSVKLGLNIPYRCRNGRWLKEKDSNLLNDPPHRTIKWWNLFVLMFYSAPSLVIFICLTYAWRFAKLGGINQGVISILNSFASIINIIVFYFAFGEKTNATQIFGIALMLVCIFLISF